MSQNEIDKLHAGEPNLKRQEHDLEDKIREEVDSEFPNMPESSKSAIVESRLKIQVNGNRRPELIRVDLGDNASRRIKEELFE